MSESTEHDAASPTTTPPRPRKKGRSPNYPGIDLGSAVMRAKSLFEHEQHHPAPSNVILSHWGYAPKSGGGSVVFAALKRFGLLEDASPGHAKLSQLALDILHAEADDRRPHEELRHAALAPTLHKTLWDQYGPTLPSDESLKFKLTTEKGFTPGGATEFISEWKRTMAYAQLTEADVNIPASDETSVPSVAEETMSAATAATPPAATPPSPSAVQAPTSAPLPVNVNLATGAWITLQASARVTEAEWDQFMAVLNAMKPGLIEPV
jgi:hypothetical protein